VLHSVNTYPIDGVSRGEVLNPVVHRLNDLLVLSVEIRERKLIVTQPALFNSGLVLGVVCGINCTAGVEVISRGEGDCGRVVEVARGVWKDDEALQEERVLGSVRVQWRGKFNSLIDDNVDH